MVQIRMKSTSRTTNLPLYRPHSRQINTATLVKFKGENAKSQRSNLKKIRFKLDRPRRAQRVINARLFYNLTHKSSQAPRAREKVRGFVACSRAPLNLLPADFFVPPPSPRPISNFKSAIACEG